MFKTSKQNWEGKTQRDEIERDSAKGFLRVRLQAGKAGGPPAKATV